MHATTRLRTHRAAQQQGVRICSSPASPPRRCGLRPIGRVVGREGVRAAPSRCCPRPRPWLLPVPFPLVKHVHPLLALQRGDGPVGCGWLVGWVVLGRGVSQISQCMPATEVGDAMRWGVMEKGRRRAGASATASTRTTSEAIRCCRWLG
jgi:hypothetical protein